MSDMLMNGMLRPIPPARINPTIIRIADIIPFFAAIPKISPSIKSKITEMIEEYASSDGGMRLIVQTTEPSSTVIWANNSCLVQEI